MERTSAERLDPLPGLFHSHWERWFLLVLMLTAHPPRGMAEEMIFAEGLRRDAVLRDIEFVDGHSGWAVGESGAIWHTDNGGAQWQLQNIPVRCQLYAVSFLDSQTGWAAGGWTEPYTQLRRGTLLRTSDGGKNWSLWSKDPLPTIKKIQFFNLQEGIAVVAASPLYPHGVLITKDGGRSWATPPNDGDNTWQCGDFKDLRTGCVAGGNQFGVMRAGQIRSHPSKKSRHTPASWTCICMGDDQVGYALDAVGSLHITRDGGNHWEQQSALPLPSGFIPQAMEAKGRHLWICGSPGHQILHSDDGGIHWAQQSTGQSLPLWDLHFQSPQLGWAAGEFGTILSTENGGRQWSIQQQQRERAAVLGVFATARETPLEAFTQLSAAEGYSSSVVLLGYTPLSPSVPLDVASAREREALLLTGVNAVDQGFRLPLPATSRQTAVPASFAATPCLPSLCPKPFSGENIIRAFESHVERQIRLYRPDLIVTHPATQRGADPLGFEINQAVLRAVERAADKQGNQNSMPGLATWQVRKVYASMPPRISGGLALSTRRWMIPLGSTLAEYAQPARALLGCFPEKTESVLHFSLLLNNLPQGRGSSNFFGGLHLAPGSGARRTITEDYNVPVDRLQHRVSRANILRAVLASAGAGQPSPAAWRAQIHRAAAELPTDQAARVLVDIATENFARGKAPLAADTLALLIDHCPDHPLTAAAWKWLLTYHASGEFRQRFGEEAPDKVQLATARATNPIKPETPPGATGWGERLQRTAPVLFNDPRIQLPLAAAYRAQGNSRQAQRIALMLSRSPWLAPYTACGFAEANLPAGDSADRRPRWIATRTESKPYLDGHLDEACWSVKTNGVELIDRGSATDASTQVQVCFDQQYLYFGLRCQKAAGIPYPASPAARKRDAELDRHDRVQLLIDVDRDYATSYRLTVDSRGCTHDQLWMDATWDPVWYVATADTQTHWMCELAIRLDALSDQKRTEDRLWACGVQRILPGKGFQSWSHPASIEVDPSGFGHLQLPLAIE